MPHKLSVLVLSDQASSTPVSEVVKHDIVVMRHSGTDKGSEYEVIRNRFGDAGGHLSDAVVQNFLSACGVRSAT